MTAETPLSRWLRDEMPRHGYPLEGRRAGGVSRLAADAGIPQATMSRLVHGQSTPDVQTLRKLAPIFHVSLDKMLVIAGLANPDEFDTPRLTLIDNPEYEPTIEELVGGFRDADEAAIAAVEKASVEYRIKAILMRRRVLEAATQTRDSKMSNG